MPAVPPTTPGIPDAPGISAHATDPPRRVLIVRPTALGDVARTVPALVSLRRAYPQAAIDWLVNASYAAVVRHHPALSAPVEFPRRRFAALAYNPKVLAEAVGWSRRLRRRGYDLVFDLQGLLRSGVFAWLTAAPQRIGFADARELGWLGCNRRYAVDGAVHTVDRMLGLLEAHGLAIERDMRLYVGDADEQSRLEYFSRHHIEPDEPYAVVAPTARWLCKCWPLDRFADVIRRLLDMSQQVSRVLVLAAPQEARQIQSLRNRFARDARVLFPPTRVGDMMAIISKTKLLVCNDSAPLHVAVGFNRSIVTIFGPTDPAKVGPYRRPDTVLQPPGIQPADMLNYRRRDDQSLIARVTIDAVWAKALEQMKREE